LYNPSLHPIITTRRHHLQSSSRLVQNPTSFRSLALLQLAPSVDSSALDSDSRQGVRNERRECSSHLLLLLQPSILVLRVHRRKTSLCTGGVEWDATNYLASHLDMLNGILACLPTREERNALREELLVSGWEK